MTRKVAVAIQHVAFEGLGTIEPMLVGRGYDVTRLDACIEPLPHSLAREADLVVVLGGPIGAYEEATYPFLLDELAILERRLLEKQPTLGICLGAQLMARALGARVYTGPRKEIGWAPVTVTADGRASPLSALADGVRVLHWHGDTFDLPRGCRRLANTELTANQAFDVGSYGLGLQFHAECDGSDIEHWLVGHATELAHAGIDIQVLRSESRTYGPAVARAGATLFAQWLDRLP